MEISLSIIDLVFILLILAATVRGVFRGFVAEVGSVAALVLGIGGAILFSKSLARVVEKYFGDSFWNQLIAFLIIFLAVYITVKLLESLLSGIFERLNLERLDRVLGFFLGIAEGILLVGVVLFVLSWQPFFKTESFLSESIFSKALSPFLPSPAHIFNPRVFLKNA